MATFLDRALDLPDATQDYFTDDNGSTHEDAINRVAEAGIASGCTATTFCPNGTGDARADGDASSTARSTSPNTDEDYFTDDETSTHEDADQPHRGGRRSPSAARPTTFCPKNPVTRGQMTAFLHRAMGD